MSIYKVNTRLRDLTFSSDGEESDINEIVGPHDRLVSERERRPIRRRDIDE